MSGLSVFSYFKPSLAFTCLGRLLCFMGRKNCKPYKLFNSFLIITLLLSAPLSAWAEKPSGIDLTPAEQAWLAEHPVITLGGGVILPLDYIDGDGRNVGLGPDYTKLVFDHLGIKVNYVTGNVSELLERVKEKKLDGFRIFLKSKEREEIIFYVPDQTTQPQG